MIPPPFCSAKKNNQKENVILSFIVNNFAIIVYCFWIEQVFLYVFANKIEVCFACQRKYVLSIDLNTLNISVFSHNVSLNHSLITPVTRVTAHMRKILHISYWCKVRRRKRASNNVKSSNDIITDLSETISTTFRDAVIKFNRTANLLCKLRKHARLAAFTSLKRPNVSPFASSPCAFVARNFIVPVSLARNRRREDWNYAKVCRSSGKINRNEGRRPRKDRCPPRFET